MPYSQCCNAFIETIFDDSVCPSCLQECEFDFADDILIAKKSFISPPRDRPVTIRIYTNGITFHFPNEGDREFYWIDKERWISDRTERLDRGDNFHNHMRHKNWFMEEMAEFINKNTQ